MCDDCGCGDTDKVSVEIHESLLAGNASQAAHNREHFAARGMLALNLMGSPGSGKTALLEATARALARPGGLAPPPRGALGRPRHRPRWGPAARRRHSGRHDHHRLGLSPRRQAGPPCPPPPRPRRRRHAGDRERRQSRLPGDLRPRRGGGGGGALGDRGRGQAAQVPDDVPPAPTWCCSPRSTCCRICPASAWRCSRTRSPAPCRGSG